MDWKLWSPFQSASVVQICDHMTESERLTTMRRGGQYGIWVAATFAIPTGVLVVALTAQLNPVLVGAIVGVAAGLMIVHVCCIPAWLRAQRRFLCSTQWAREQGLRPEGLRLFAARRTGWTSDL